MNQISTFNQLLSSLGIPEEYKTFFVIVFSVLVLITMTISVLEKLGISTLISKLFNRRHLIEHELKALDELMSFEKTKQNDAKKFPYIEPAYKLKEILLLNNYFKSNINDLDSLKYVFNRKDNKRAFRLHSPLKSKIFLKKINENYFLKPWVKWWMIYIPMIAWLFIYIGTALYLFVPFIQSNTLQEKPLTGSLAYILIAVTSVFIGWIASPLLWPWQAKTFTKLEKS